jgi:alpha-mannosidase
MDFMRSLKKTTKSAITDTVELSDVNDIIKDNVDDWKEMMTTRAQNGFNFITIEFEGDERVYILNKNGKTIYDIDKPHNFNNDTKVLRSYPVGQFYNSDTFNDAVTSLFPGCSTSLEYIGNNSYVFKISW